jgi:hypothetical protein
MAQRISLEKAQAIARARLERQLTISQLRQEFGVCEKTVVEILRDPEGKRYRTGPTAEPSREIKYRDTGKYFCARCQRMVLVRPCPACVARGAIQADERSAVAGVSDPAPEPPGPQDAVIPPDVAHWSLAWLRRMIHCEADIGEAIEVAAGQLRGLITAQAYVIAEECRRQRICPTGKH